MSPLLTNAELDTVKRYFGMALARMAMAEATLAGGDEPLARKIVDTFMARYRAEQNDNREIHEAQKAAEREGR